MGELVNNQALANLVSLGMTYVISCVLMNRLLNPLAGFGVAAVQGIFSGRWSLLGIIVLSLFMRENTAGVAAGQTTASRSGAEKMA